MQRLAKAISAAGICSRREAEALITSGKVAVDGVVITSPATTVDENNKIEVSGKQINTQADLRLWTYYKPVGLITTHKDTHSRETVFQNLKGLPRVISIGRLDMQSEGLLLLTNNGDLARRFELPANAVERTYKVRAYGDIEAFINYTKDIKPIIIDKERYNPKSIKLISSAKTNSWFEVILTEGKNREIRKIFAAFGLKVNRLIRTRYGPFSLGSLKPGEYKEQNIYLVNI